MKYFFPVLMAVVILFGIALTVTPYLAEWLYPLPASSYQKAKPDDARKAVAEWFNVAPASVTDAQAIRQRTPEGTRAWFVFALPREPVAQFVVDARLQQQALSAESMQQVFMAVVPPVEWWQPASLGRETWFSGKSGTGQDLALVYNADKQQGFLLVKTTTPPAKP